LAYRRRASCKYFNYFKYPRGCRLALNNTGVRLEQSRHQSNKEGKTLADSCALLRSDVRDGGGEGWLSGPLALTGDGYACRV
jgi:hypothetical protein